MLYGAFFFQCGSCYMPCWKVHHCPIYKLHYLSSWFLLCFDKCGPCGLFNWRIFYCRRDQLLNVWCWECVHSNRGHHFMSRWYSIGFCLAKNLRDENLKVPPYISQWSRISYLSSYKTGVFPSRNMPNI